MPENNKPKQPVVHHFTENEMLHIMKLCRIIINPNDENNSLGTHRACLEFKILGLSEDHIATLLGTA